MSHLQQSEKRISVKKIAYLCRQRQHIRTISKQGKKEKPEPQRSWFHESQLKSVGIRQSIQRAAFTVNHFPSLKAA
jgi:hypothetical protein